VAQFHLDLFIPGITGGVDRAPNLIKGAGNCSQLLVDCG
jgi:hypothetical protein